VLCKLQNKVATSVIKKTVF